MKVASEKVDDGTITTTEGAETPAPVATVENKAASTVTTEPELPNREANEKLIGRGVSTRERRTNTPPVLVRLNRHKAQVHEEIRTRTEDCDGGKKKAVEREVVKRKQFEEFAATHFVGGIVEGMQSRTHLMRTQAESRLDEANTEFVKFDDGVHFEHRVLHEREAAARRIERELDQEAAVTRTVDERELESRTSTDRWIEQRELEQQAIEQRTEHERDLLDSRSERSRYRGRNEDPRQDEYQDEQRYYEHNYLNRRNRNDD